MHVFVCLDERNGMLFNGRRQSRDRAVVADLLASAGGRLWASPFSETLLGSAAVYDENFLRKAQRGESCFVENVSLEGALDQIESITVYRWNRVYPADLYWVPALSGGPWHLAQSHVFSGFSHEKITKEVYTR